MSDGHNNDGNGDGDSDDSEDEDGDEFDMSAMSVFQEQTFFLGESFEPFPSKIFALFYILLLSPRPLGETNLKLIWYTLSQCGISVPSFTTVKKFKLPGLTPPKKVVTTKGIPFYYNTITSIVRRCIGNPEISSTVHRYPIVPTGSYREIFHASRWLNDSRFFSPMICLPNGMQVFINDCVTCRHQLLGLVNCRIVKYFMKELDDNVYADVDILLNLEQHQQLVPETLACYLPYGTLIVFERATIPVLDIVSECPKPLSLLKWDSSNRTLHQFSSERTKHYLLPHAMKERAAGRPVVMLPLILFSDDTSGNRSKKWHKFDSWSVMLAGLPRKENSKIPNIHFCCCSDVISAMELSEAIAPELIQLEKEGVEAFDSALNKKVLLVAPLLCILGDNPRSSEILNHLGGSARLYCRMCMADRDVNPTILSTKRTLPSALRQIEEIKDQTTEKDKAKLRTEYGIKEIPNPMLTLPVDLFKSTPIESLHSILLGPYKYLLKCTIPKLSAREKEEILARIRAFSFSGFRVKLHGNVIRHHQSFVGRDYKAWAQMAPFIIFPYINDGDKEVWLSLTKVFKIAYCDYYDPSKDDEWCQICKDFVDAVSRHQNSMLKKQKVHLILHLVECMRDFGPTSGFNSERCETFNSYIRSQNIYGNKSSPSHDIASKFAAIEQLRFICEGGYERCGKDLKELFSTSTVQHFINCKPMCEVFGDKEIYQPGTLRKKKQGSVKVSSAYVNLPDANGLSLHDLHVQQPPFTLHIEDLHPDDLIEEHFGVIGRDKVLIHTGDYVKLQSSHYEMSYGILLACWKRADGYKTCLIRGLESLCSPQGDAIENDLGCPLLYLTNTLFTTRTHELQKGVSVVHECGSSCKFSQTSCSRHIERESVPSSQLVYLHDCTNLMYCLNIYCMNTN